MRTHIAIGINEASLPPTPPHLDPSGDGPNGSPSHFLPPSVECLPSQGLSCHQSTATGRSAVPSCQTCCPHGPIHGVLHQTMHELKACSAIYTVLPTSVSMATTLLALIVRVMASINFPTGDFFLLGTSVEITLQLVQAPVGKLSF